MKIIKTDRYMLDSGAEVVARTYEVIYFGVPVVVREITGRGIEIKSICEPWVAKEIIENWS